MSLENLTIEELNKTFIDKKKDLKKNYNKLKNDEKQKLI